jgi:hypothetical protein
MDVLSAIEAPLPAVGGPEVVCTYGDNFAAAGSGHAGARSECGAEHCDG